MRIHFKWFTVTERVVNLSAIMSIVHTTGVLVSVQAGVGKLTTEEGGSELRRSGVILGRHISLSGLLTDLHARRLEEGVANLDSLFGVLNLVNLSREGLGRNVNSLNGILVGFDVLINEDIEFTVLTHLLQDFVLVSFLGVLQS